MTLPRRYELVILPSGSFCLLTDPKVIRDSLAVIHSVMPPGATLVLEIELRLNRESESPPWTGRWVDLPEGGRIVISTLATYDAVACAKPYTGEAPGDTEETVVFECRRP